MKLFAKSALVAGALALAVGALAVGALAVGTAHAADYTMKISMSHGPYKDHYEHTPLLQFQKEVNEKSGGRIDVKIYWNFALGKNEKVINMVRNGQVEGIITSESHAAPYWHNVEVLSIPYLFINRKVAYRVFDGPFGKELADRMAKESGIRPLVWLENGGYRNFTANKPLRTVADMKGLKIRTMTNPVHMQIVRSLGASPTPISWADLYTALQTGVVDGEENSLPTFRIPKLEEVQKYVIMDGHIYSVLAFFVSEKWYKSLPADLRKIVDTAAQRMVPLNRKLSIENEKRDRAYLESKGVHIFDPTPETKKKFRELTQGPAIEMIKKNVDPKLLNDLLKAVKDAEAKS